MRRNLQLLLVLLFGLGFTHVMAGSGGPDVYGYTWKDSDELDHDFTWVDITGRPGAVHATGLFDDNAIGPVNIGWNFHYYWSDYSTIKIGSNGWVSFNNVGNIASCFPLIPTQGGAGDNLIAIFMSDLQFLNSYPAFPNLAELWYWSNNVDSFVIQYKNVGWWADDNSGTNPPNWVGSNNFELILNGADSSIVFNYLDTDQANLSVSGACPTDLEIGIENLTGNIGLGVITGQTVPNDSFSIKFFYPDSVTFQVPDATPVWNANTENAGQFIYTNVPYTLETNIENVGNGDITNTITATGTVRNLQLTQVWTSPATQSGLNAGANVTLSFPLQLNLTNAGQYYYRVALSNNQDINPSNNNNEVELSAVNNNGGQSMLSYATGGVPDGSISWTGGGINDGVAVKMVPPGYPAVVDSISVFILGDGDLQTPLPVGFSLAIYGSDVNGDVDLNNLLQWETITAIDARENDWNRILLDSTVTVNSGAIFVTWLQGGGGIALGTETTGPKSRRGFEILGGGWAPYRNNTVDEFLIQVSATLPVANSPRHDANFGLVAFPNPTDTRLTVDYTLNMLSDVDFSLQNSLGQTVWHKTHHGIDTGIHRFDIMTEALPAGIYFLQMQAQGEQVTHKIVVE